jgi:hypothetical protein
MARSGVSRGWRSPACTRWRTERSRTAGTRKASGATKSWRISGWNLPSSGSAASSCPGGDDQPFARKAALSLTLGSERPHRSRSMHQISIGLADEGWPGKLRMPLKTSSMPSVSRFPRKRTNPTRRLAHGLSGRTSLFAAATVRRPTMGSGRSTPQVPHLNVIKLRQWPRRRARECQPIRYRSTQGRILASKDQRAEERNAGVTFLGTCPSAAGRMATSSSLKSGTVSNAGSSINSRTSPSRNSFSTGRLSLHVTVTRHGSTARLCCTP